MGKSINLTDPANEGFLGAVCVYPASSANSLAHNLGEWFQRTGRPPPRDVQMARGSRRHLFALHASDMVFMLDMNGWVRIK